MPGLPGKQGSLFNAVETAAAGLCKLKRSDQPIFDIDNNNMVRLYYTIEKTKRHVNKQQLYNKARCPNFLSTDLVNTTYLNAFKTRAVISLEIQRTIRERAGELAPAQRKPRCLAVVPHAILVRHGVLMLVLKHAFRSNPPPHTLCSRYYAPSSLLLTQGLLGLHSVDTAGRGKPFVPLP